MTENPLSLLAQVARIPVFRSAAEIPTGFGPTVASVGNFDGVHCGHREILSAVVGEAHQTGARAVAITFDPHPEQFLRPLEAPRLLTPIAQRLSLLAGAGVDAVVLLPFDAPLANLPAAEFVRQTVSYTHLDVYKRQAHNQPFNYNDGRDPGTAGILAEPPTF